MRWPLHFDRAAVEAIYAIPKEIRSEAKPIIWSLQDVPFPEYAQPDEDDPSKLWIALPGDYVLTYEIIDELHIVRIIEIE
jgi:mRNA-degrading endonuclease RelE of RelBE toxin-antitoxin system